MPVAAEASPEEQHPELYKLLWQPSSAQAEHHTEDTVIKTAWQPQPLFLLCAKMALRQSPLQPSQPHHGCQHCSAQARSAAFPAGPLTPGKLPRAQHLPEGLGSECLMFSSSREQSQQAVGFTVYVYVCLFCFLSRCLSLCRNYDI